MLASSTLKDLDFFSNKVDWMALKADLGDVEWLEAVPVSAGTKDMPNNYIKSLEKVCVQYIPSKLQKRKKIITRDRMIMMRKRGNVQIKKILKQDNQQNINIENQLLD